MFWSAIGFCTFLVALIHVYEVAIYITSAIVGVASGPLWVAQGAFLTKNSTHATRGVSATFFWTIFQTSGVLGNLFVFLSLFHYQLNLQWVFLVLAVICLAGALSVVVYRLPVDLEGEQRDAARVAALAARAAALGTENLVSTAHDREEQALLADDRGVNGGIVNESRAITSPITNRSSSAALDDSTPKLTTLQILRNALRRPRAWALLPLELFLGYE
jgi:MFS family permease